MSGNDNSLRNRVVQNREHVNTIQVWWISLPESITMVTTVQQPPESYRDRKHVTQLALRGVS